MFLVYFSIFEPAQICICAVSVYNIYYQNQNVCLPLIISQIQINAPSDSLFTACGLLIGKQSMPH